MELAEARTIISGLDEEGGDAAAAARQYSEDIRPEMRIIEGGYPALNEFAFSLSAINRAAQGGGPKVQQVRKRRLQAIKKRTKVWMKMINDALNNI